MLRLAVSCLLLSADALQLPCVAPRAHSRAVPAMMAKKAATKKLVTVQLKTDVEGLGPAGKLVEIKPYYASNFEVVQPPARNVHNGLEVNDSDRHVVFSEECRGVFETLSTFGVDRNAAFAPPPLDYDGLPGVVPTELPPVPRGVELPLWLDSYLQKNGRAARL